MVSEWKAVSLEDISQIVGGGTPSKEKTEYWGGEIPWVTPTDVTRGKVRKLEFTENRITKIGLSESSAKLIPSGSILMTTRATIGECVINMIPMATNQGFTNFICNERVYNEYLYYALCRHKIDFERLGSGSTFKEVSKRTIRSFKVMLPPLPEQRKIAAILSSVDEAIEKTEAIIEQTETVKKGLMQQLLTRGIGHIRFKQTEIGEIPEEWEVRLLEQVCERIFVGIATSTTENYATEGVPILRNQNIKEDMLEITELLYITPEFSERNKSKKLVRGDVLTVRTGYPGITCVVPDRFEGCHTFTTLVSRPQKEILNSYFLSRYINSYEGKRFVFGGKAGGAQQNLNVSIMKKLPVPIPPLQEQQQIVDILSSVDHKITKEHSYLTQLQTLKKGLMQVLLTGKVRVKVDEPEEVAVP